MPDPLVPSDRTAEAAWFGAGLTGFGGRVDQNIPRGYAAYARVLHPARDENNQPARWSNVAARSGTVLHPRAQFHSVAGRWEYDRRKGHGWPGKNPTEGSLAPGQLRVLCEVLARHTDTPDKCWLAVWEGYGNLPVAWKRTAPRVHQPDRAYFLFERPLSKVQEFSIQIEEAGWDQDPLPSSMGYLVRLGPEPVQQDQTARGEPAEPDWIQSPNQWWPQDRAWCVVSEIDFDSTLVAGSDYLVAELTARPDLEAFRIEPTDDLTCEGDLINPPPAPDD
jgi:hypothetical protein